VQAGARRNVRLGRRAFLRLAGTSALCAASGAWGLAGCRGGPYTRDPELPNLLFLTADNLGWRDLSCYGNPNIETSHIDRLAREGVLFERAFVVSSSCAPSRASFITGQYPHTHGVTGLTHLEPRKSLSPFHPTLPDLLSERGLHTAIEGKWHVSPYLPTSWYGYADRLSGLLPSSWPVEDAETTRAFLREARDHRFFLQVNYQSSHRDEYGEYPMDPDFPVDPDAVQVPDYMALPDWPEIREDLARYYSQNLRMDSIVGDVLEALDELDLAERTLVVFVSDNGPHYPGMISTLYDRGCATPLLLRWPERLPAGRRVRALVSSLDLMPTMLEAAGIAVPEAVQGRSLWPLLRGRGPGAAEEAAVRAGDTAADPVGGARRASGAADATRDAETDWRDAVFLEQTAHVRYIPCRAIRTDRWKYIRNWSDTAFGLDQNAHDDWAHRLCDLPGHGWKSPRPREELYDLARDPTELRNLADDPAHADRLAELRDRLERHMAETDDPYLGKPFTEDFDPADYPRLEPGHEYW